MRREEYVTALQNERAHVEKNLLDPGRREARLDAIDAELDRLSDRPQRRRRETTSVPPPPPAPPAQ